MEGMGKTDGKKEEPDNLSASGINNWSRFCEVLRMVAKSSAEVIQFTEYKKQPRDSTGSKFMTNMAC